ncbi:FG-GAP-like repeat-containing protein [Leptolyngbya sp. 7M]|uniref:FG-GAP-like repeat-containing protein n=1 Tax=Leptolyngbya sp. 7M TaxID=2812896 RepID=UPI001B8A9ACE|nr:FG-GAP-like repeat-containing protein [Leptolyngbya sp. 7M]QYO66255.1 FG-GAP-like repeat-containing protein [Leptolyngbya sp. 7M]
MPTLLGTITDPSATITAGNNMHSSWTSEDGNYLYSARETTGSNGPHPGDLRVYDISNPANPLLINRVTMSDLQINAVTPHNPVVMGNKLYVSWYQAGTQIFDISDPTILNRVGQYDSYPQEYVPAEYNGEFDDEPWDIVCGRQSLSSNLPTSYAGNWAVFPFLGEDKVLLGDLATGLYIIDVSDPNFISDFDGDGRTDLSVWNPTTGFWSIQRSSNGSNTSVQWGDPGDIPVAADYDGDGKSDQAIFRPSTGTWWFIRSSDGSRPAVQFGAQGDIPVVGDYDGDGRADIAIFRPSNGVWYIAKSSGGFHISQWGLEGDKPISIDHDGDGKTDLAVWRPSDGVWYIVQSSNGEYKIHPFGMSGDRPVRTDFNGDGRSELTIYRPSTGIWFVYDPVTFASYGFQFGIAEDIPIPSDFDGDGKTDIAVYRPSANEWYRINSTGGAVVVRQFGSPGEVASPASVQVR